MADIGFLGDVLVRIDRSGAPPWPAYAWNAETRAWDAIGIIQGADADLHNLAVSGSLHLDADSPVLGWPTDDDINRSDTLTLQPHGPDKIGAVNVAPSGNSHVSYLTLFTQSNVNAPGQAILAFGGGVTGARANTFAFASVVFADLTAAGQDIGFIVGGSYGRTEALTLQASTGNVGVNEIEPAAQLGVVNRVPTQPAFDVEGAAGQTQPLQRWKNSDGATLALVDDIGGAAFTALQATSAARITSGDGEPTRPGGVDPGAGDLYIRRDTPTIPNQRLYMCTSGGASPTWLGIV